MGAQRRERVGMHLFIAWAQHRTGERNSCTGKSARARHRVKRRLKIADQKRSLLRRQDLLVEPGEPVAEITGAPERLREQSSELRLARTAIFIFKINQQILRHLASVQGRVETARAQATRKRRREKGGLRPLARQLDAGQRTACRGGDPQ